MQPLLKGLCAGKHGSRGNSTHAADRFLTAPLLVQQVLTQTEAMSSCLTQKYLMIVFASTTIRPLHVCIESCVQFHFVLSTGWNCIACIFCNWLHISVKIWWHFCVTEICVCCLTDYVVFLCSIVIALQGNGNPLSLPLWRLFSWIQSTPEEVSWLLPPLFPTVTHGGSCNWSIWWASISHLNPTAVKCPSILTLVKFPMILRHPRVERLLMCGWSQVPKAGVRCHSYAQACPVL